MSVAFAAPALTVTSADAAPLRQFMWKYRPLVVFAPTSSNQELIRQHTIVSGNVTAFRERNIVVVEVIGSSVRSRLGPLSSATANALRKHYGVAGRQFRAVLVGKDGRSKLQSGRAMSTNRLFGTIDSMPMRRNEMRRGR